MTTDDSACELKVLIAEDDPALADVLRLSFARAGFEVIVAWDGEIAADHASRTRFDVVCSDFQMPSLNGEQLFRAIRASGASQDAIGLLCSAKAYELDCERISDELGLHAVFFKPFSLAEIVSSARDAISARDVTGEIVTASAECATDS